MFVYLLLKKTGGPWTRHPLFRRAHPFRPRAPPDPQSRQFHNGRRRPVRQPHAVAVRIALRRLALVQLLVAVALSRRRQPVQRDRRFCVTKAASRRHQLTRCRHLRACRCRRLRLCLRRFESSDSAERPPTVTSACEYSLRPAAAVARSRVARPALERSAVASDHIVIWSTSFALSERNRADVDRIISVRVATGRCCSRWQRLRTCCRRLAATGSRKPTAAVAAAAAAAVCSPTARRARALQRRRPPQHAASKEVLCPLRARCLEALRSHGSAVQCTSTSASASVATSSFRPIGNPQSVQ